MPLDPPAELSSQTAAPAPDARADGGRTAGVCIRERRKQLGVSATAAAEAAGLSRVTLHRIERDEPTVSMGAYLAMFDVLGLRLQVVETSVDVGAAIPTFSAASAPSTPQALPARIRLSDYPQLQRLAWQTGSATELTAAEALNLYERNWRHLDPATLDAAERDLVDQLVQQVGNGRLLV
jgi:transcriptional regulator with XRE-family HTH domain